MAIRVHPVKSLAAVEVSRAEITADGLTGDRSSVVVDDRTGEPLRERTAPGLGTVAPSGDVQVDQDAIRAVLGRPVRVVPADRPQVMVGAVHLVSRQSLERAAVGDVPDGCSAADPRANLLVDVPGQDERTWVGREVVVGSVRLRVTRTPQHCLGVYCEVLVPGPVALRDAVRVVSASAPSGGPGRG